MPAAGPGQVEPPSSRFRSLPAALAFGLPWGLALGYAIWLPADWSVGVLVALLPFALFWMSAYVAGSEHRSPPSASLALLAGCVGAASTWFPWSGQVACSAYFLWPVVAGFSIPLLSARRAPQTAA